MSESSAYSSIKNYWQQHQRQLLSAYAQRDTDFVAHLLPEIAVQLSGSLVLETLAKRLGIRQMQTALSLEEQIPSPIEQHTTTDWIKRVNMVG